MTATRSQRLLAVVLDDEVIGDDLVRELAASSDAHGELVRLAAVLARLPGDGARAAEERLDGLLEDVALAAASASRAFHGSDAMFAEAPPDHQPVPAPRATRPRIGVPVLAAVAAAVVAGAIVAAWPRHDAGGATSRGAVDPRPVAPSPPPAPSIAPRPPAPPPRAAPPPALVNVEIHAQPATASIWIDGKPVAGNPFSWSYAADGGSHRVRVAAPGYRDKSVAVVFNANITIDLSLDRIEPNARVAAVIPPGAVPAATVPPAAMPADHADELDARAAMPRDEVEQVVAPMQPKVGKILITTGVPGCQIAIDDAVVATTPLGEPLQVTAGRRKVSVMREGYAAATVFVDVVAARTIELAISAPGINAAGGKRPVRPIDQTNVYRATP